MFLEQIKSSRVSGIVHVCDAQSIGGTLECLYNKCSYCGAIYFPSFPKFLPPDEVVFAIMETEDEFLQKYKLATGDFRTDEEVEQEMKSLWKRIKEWFR